MWWCVLLSMEVDLFVGSDVTCKQASDLALSVVAPAVDLVTLVEGEERLAAVLVAQAFPQPTKVVGQVAQAEKSGICLLKKLLS